MRLALIAGFTLFAAAAHATDLVPTQTLRYELDEDTSAMIAYSPGLDGYRVVATVQQVTEVENVLLRVTTVLSSGQWADVAVPRLPGEPRAAMRIVRNHDTVRVEAPPSELSRR